LFAQLTLAAHWTPVDASTIARGEALERMGFQHFDALHIACAEQAADVFLTTDDRLLRRAARLSAQMGITVSNPAKWLKEAK
jgi:hypothetical protein